MTAMRARAESDGVGPDWPGAVALPDRTLVRGRGVRHGTPTGPEPDFGLYLGVDHHPSWPHERVEWPNFGLPRDAVATARAIADAYERARAGQRVEVACWAGRGRTGTAISCMAILAGLRADHAVGWTRHHYEHRAVETPWQRWWVRGFPALLARAREPR